MLCCYTAFNFDDSMFCGRQKSDGFVCKSVCLLLPDQLVGTTILSTIFKRTLLELTVLKIKRRMNYTRLVVTAVLVP